MIVPDVWSIEAACAINILTFFTAASLRWQAICCIHDRPKVVALAAHAVPFAVVICKTEGTPDAIDTFSLTRNSLDCTTRNPSYIGTACKLEKRGEGGANSEPGVGCHTWPCLILPNKQCYADASYQRMYASSSRVGYQASPVFRQALADCSAHAQYKLQDADVTEMGDWRHLLIHLAPLQRCPPVIQMWLQGEHTVNCEQEIANYVTKIHYCGSVHYGSQDITSHSCRLGSSSPKYCRGRREGVD